MDRESGLQDLLEVMTRGWMRVMGLLKGRVQGGHLDERGLGLGY